MTKSIHYKVTRARTSILLDVISIPNPWQLEPDPQELAFIMENNHTNVFQFKTESEAKDWCAKIHAAIHAEFGGEWEPKEGEMVNVKDKSDKDWSPPREFLMTDKDGMHWAIGYQTTLQACSWSWDEIRPLNQPEIPTGPCEVAYGVEGLQEGVQVSESDLCGPCEQDLINAGRQSVMEEILDEIEAPARDELTESTDTEFVSIIARVFRQADDLKSHISALETKRKIDDHNMEAVCHIEEKMKLKINRLEKELEAAKKKPVIRLKKVGFNRDLIVGLALTENGYDFEWIGGEG